MVIQINEQFIHKLHASQMIIVSKTSELQYVYPLQMLRSVVQGLSCLRLHGTGLAQSVAARESVCASGAAVRALPQPLLQHVRVG